MRGGSSGATHTLVTDRPPDAQGFTVAARKAAASGPEFADNAWHTLRHELQAKGEGGNPFCIELLVDPPWYDDSRRRLGVLYRDPPWVQ